jgi:transcription elongation GreA/GreB family factor
MTTSAWRSLVDELGQLRARLQTLGSPSPNHGDHLPWAVARSQYERLSAVLDKAERVDASPGAVIGRRVTLLEDDGLSNAYVLVCPGQGDPARGWVAADSPLGGAILGAVAGDVVDVLAPAGRRAATVLSVE